MGNWLQQLAARLWAPSQQSAPRFTHNCSDCVFLGPFEETEERAYTELYFCKNGPGPTPIARYSSRPPDYASGMPSAALMPELAEACRRAKERGLL